MEARGTRTSSALDGVPPEGPLHDLALTIRRLWPQASTVALRTSGRPERRALVAVPSTVRPRLLVPPGRAAGRSLARYNLALSRRETVQRVVAVSALALGAGRWPTGRLVVDEDAGGVTAELERVLGEPVRVSLSIGTARANRKPVLQVFDRRGRSLAFVKVGDSPTAAEHVGGEAEALARLGERTFTVVRHPRLLHVGAWSGMRLLVMSSLPTRPQWRDVPRLRAAAEREVAGVEEAAVALRETPMWGRVTAAAERTQGDRQERLAEGLAAVGRRYGDQPVRVGAWHGDWTPWNMAARGSVLQVWDWERYETGVPVGLDRLHHEVNLATRHGGSRPDVMLDALRRTVAAGRDLVNDADLLVLSYLLAVGGRYALAATGPGGGAISARADAVLVALTTATRELEGR